MATTTTSSMTMTTTTGGHHEDIQLTNILDYLQSLPRKSLDALYKDTSTCMTIFRSLPRLAQYYVVRLLYSECNVIPKDVVDCWYRAGSDDLHDASMERLAELRVFYDAEDDDDDDDDDEAIDGGGANQQQQRQGKAAAAAAVAGPAYVLHVQFKNSLRRALQDRILGQFDVDSGGSDADTVISDDERDAIAAALDEHAWKQWEKILRFMVRDGTVRLDDEVLQLLKANSFVTGSLKMTARGLSFLFRARHTQVWQCLISKLKSYEEEERHDVMTFLFRLSFLIEGRRYPVANVKTGVQRLFLTFLAHLGLVYMEPATDAGGGGRGRGDVDDVQSGISPAVDGAWYYITPLSQALSATTSTSATSSSSSSEGSGVGEGNDDADLPPTTVSGLLQAVSTDSSSKSSAASQARTSSGASSSAASTSTGFVLVETTFRVYAFTTSKVHKALLGSFLRIEAVLPNVVIGKLTKASVRTALKNNITSREIITYLEAHAHPEQRRGTPILPVNVTHQLRLWEGERRRMRFIEDVVMFDRQAFLSADDYRDVETLCRRHQVLLHTNPVQRMMIVTQAGRSMIQQYRRGERVRPPQPVSPRKRKRRKQDGGGGGGGGGASSSSSSSSRDSPPDIMDLS